MSKYQRLRRLHGLPGLLAALTAAILLTLACAGPATSTPIPDNTIPLSTATPTARPSLAAACRGYSYCKLLEPGDWLTAAAWLDAEWMYLADYQGKIRLLNVATGEVKTALTGLSKPQGLTVLDGRLYVSSLGNVCEVLQQQAGDPDICYRSEISVADQMEVLLTSRAEILSYAIGPEGSLSDRQVVVDNILSANESHSPNGLTNDGEWIYASIGFPYEGKPISYGGFVTLEQERLQASGGRTDLMGSIIRFRPGDDDVEVFATGLRNVYGISVAPDGTVYGADNDVEDGLVTWGGHLEELNAITPGGFYGIPFWGTNEAPPEAGVIEPAAVLQGTYSTFAHANADGVYVAYQYIDDREAGFVVDRFDYTTFTPTRIFNYASGPITAILERDGLLYLIAFSGRVHIINPQQHTRIFASSRRSLEQDLGVVATVVGEGQPIIRSDHYAVYFKENFLIYVKDSCAAEEREPGFLLRLLPVNAADLPVEWQEQGFARYDFPFGKYGRHYQGRCLIVHPMPAFALKRILTGQDDPATGNIRWRGEYIFE